MLLFFLIIGGGGNIGAENCILFWESFKIWDRDEEIFSCDLRSSSSWSGSFWLIWLETRDTACWRMEKLKIIWFKKFNFQFKICSLFWIRKSIFDSFLDIKIDFLLILNKIRFLHTFHTKSASYRGLLRYFSEMDLKPIDHIFNAVKIALSKTNAIRS